jgi:hypothetical protein
MPSLHIIVKPDGKAVFADDYARVWRKLKASDPAAQVKNWDHFPCDVAKVLRDMSDGLHDRINKQIPGYGQGRKWSDDWQREMLQASHRINNPRLILDWLPADIRNRFKHRLRENCI